MDRHSSSSPARLTSSPLPIDVLATTPPTSPIIESDSPIFKNLPPAPCLRTSATANAFSVLGKRKAPLLETSNNAVPRKRSALQAASKSSVTTKTQMQLSLGQKVETRCQDCGMLYVASSKEDRLLHDKFHKSANEGVSIGPVLGKRLENHRIMQKESSDDVVCCISSEDPAWMRSHARKVLDVMTTCLGAIEIPDAELWRKDKGRTHGQRYKLWLCLRGELCVAAMLVKRNVNARRVVSTLKQASIPGESALEKLKRRRAEQEQQDHEPIRVADAVECVEMGISRIWTSPSGRKTGCATAMLDAMLNLEIKDCSPAAKLNKIAFSQPTSAGARLARRWFGQQHGWLVYNEE